MNLLGRQGSAAEINGWLTVLAGAGPAGLATVATGIVHSAEFRAIQVQTMYGATTAQMIPTPDILKRAVLASPAEINGWVNSALDLLSIETLFLSSAEFAADG
jgi:hypothetical protein